MLVLHTMSLEQGWIQLNQTPSPRTQIDPTSFVQTCKELLAGSKTAVFSVPETSKFIYLKILPDRQLYLKIFDTAAELDESNENYGYLTTRIKVQPSIKRVALYPSAAIYSDTPRMWSESSPGNTSSGNEKLPPDMQEHIDMFAKEYAHLEFDEVNGYIGNITRANAVDQLGRTKEQRKNDRENFIFLLQTTKDIFTQSGNDGKQSLRGDTVDGRTIYIDGNLNPPTCVLFAPTIHINYKPKSVTSKRDAHPLTLIEQDTYNFDVLEEVSTRSHTKSYKDINGSYTHLSPPKHPYNLVLDTDSAIGLYGLLKTSSFSQ